MEEQMEVKPAAYITPIANPLLEGKNLHNSLKLIQRAVLLERAVKLLSKTDQAASKPNKKFIKRGVQEVTKSLRKGEKGVVLFASDIYPVDVVAHIPSLCEEHDVLYAFVGSKKTIGVASKTSRPASVMLISEIDTSHLQKLRSALHEVLKNQKTEENRETIPQDVCNEYEKTFKKTTKCIKKCNPFF